MREIAAATDDPILALIEAHKRSFVSTQQRVQCSNISRIRRHDFRSSV
jgi:hypothetical protein